MERVRVTIGIRHDGYNLFALGPPAVGKHTTLRQMLGREAAREAAPVDWCYVNNFVEPRRPRALRLPGGTAARLRADMEHAVAELRVAIPAAFDSDEYRNRKQQLGQDFQRRQAAAFADL